MVWGDRIVEMCRWQGLPLHVRGGEGRERWEQRQVSRRPSRYSSQYVRAWTRPSGRPGCVTSLSVSLSARTLCVRNFSAQVIIYHNKWPRPIACARRVTDTLPVLRSNSCLRHSIHSSCYLSQLAFFFFFFFKKCNYNLCICITQKSNFPIFTVFPTWETLQQKLFLLFFFFFKSHVQSIV